MNKEDVYEGLREILCAKFKLERDAVKPQSTLHEDLGLDSVEVMDAICLFEEKFDVKIIGERSEGLVLPETIGALTNLICEQFPRKLAD